MTRPEKLVIFSPGQTFRFVVMIKDREKTMNENRRILQLWQEASHARKKSVLATVVKVEGSSYRRTGARMLIVEGGEIAGCVSGGCLERDLIRRASNLNEEPVLMRYDTRSDSESSEAEIFLETIGLGCEGVIEILLDPKPERQLAPIKKVMSDRKKENLTLELPNGVLYRETLAAPPQLVIFGAGHDAVPLCQMAADVGWDVTVVDCRSSFPTPAQYFAEADLFIQSDPETIFDKLKIDEDSLMVTMTHNYEHDRIILGEILARTSPAYIGLLGPRTRSEKLLTSLDPVKVKTNFSKLHFPVGLDIGGDNPQAIALSILAEMQSVLAGRGGAPLSQRNGPIHVER